MRGLVLALSLCGCDIVFRLDDVKPNAAMVDGAVVRFGPWSVPQPIASVNTAAVEADASMTADGLTLYFASTRSGSSAPYRATRADLDAPFDMPTIVADLAMHGVSPGQISGDDMRYYFNKDGASGNEDIYVVSRASKGELFAAPTHLPELSSVQTDRNPAVTDNELVAVITRVDSPTDSVLFLFERTDLSSAWTSRELTELETNFIDSAAHLSPDGLTLVFHSDRVEQNGQMDLFIATRPALGMPFGSAVLIDTLGGPESDSDPYISPDLTKMVFSRNNDLWMATRTRL